MKAGAEVSGAEAPASLKTGDPILFASLSGLFWPAELGRAERGGFLWAQKPGAISSTF